MKKTLLLFVAFIAIAWSASAQWIEQASGFPTASRGIQHVCAVDDQVVWASAYDGVTPTAACQDITMTVNGGDLWTPHTISGVTNLSVAMVSAVNATTAWAVMYPPASSTTGMGIYKTTDGGATWARQTTATFGNASSFPNVVHFWDPNLGFCMGDPINGEFELYTTNDGGTTWTLVPGTNIPNPVSGEYGVIGYYSVVNDVVWFGTNKGRVYKSIDNGQNWTVSAITGWSAKYTQPFFRDEMNGVAQDKSQNTTGALVRTIDGGATWTAITSPGTVYTNDMCYIPGTDATYISTGADVTNSKAGVTYSFNDCATFKEMGPTIGTQFLATDWVNDSTGWAGAFNADASSGGMYKFYGILAPPDFTASIDHVAIGGSVTYTITEGVHSSTNVVWNFPGGTPATSTSKHPTVVYNTSGTYNVKLTANNSWGTEIKEYTGLIYVGGVGINEVSNAVISCYPNPVKDVLNLNSSSTIEDIKVINMVGQVVLTQKAGSNSVTVNTSDLSAGIYTVQLKMADGIANKKIVVK